MIRSRYRSVRRGMPGNEDKIINEKKARGRQSKISWQTKVGLASVLIGTSLALPVQTVKADAAESGTPAAVQKDGKAEQQNETVDQQDKQNASEDKQDQTGDDQQDKQDASEEKQDQTDNDSQQDDSKVNGLSENDGTDGDTDDGQDDDDTPVVDEGKKDTDDTGKSIEYGKQTDDYKIVEFYDEDTGEVLERHKFYQKRDEDGYFVYSDLSNFGSVFKNKIEGQYGLSEDDLTKASVQYDTKKWHPYTGFDDFASDNTLKTLRIPIKRSHDESEKWTPQLAKAGHLGDLYFNTKTFADKDGNNALMLLDNLGAMPEGTKAEWINSPKFDEEGNILIQYDDNDEVLPQYNVKFRVTVPGQTPVDFELTSQNETGSTLESLLEYVTHRSVPADMKNIFETTLGTLPDLNKGGNIIQYKDYKPEWLIKPNINRAGYSFGWLGFYDPEDDNEDGGHNFSSENAMVLVHTKPITVTKNIVYRDVKTNEQVGDAIPLSGKLSSLYTKQIVFSKDDLTSKISEPKDYKFDDSFDLNKINDIRYLKDFELNTEDAEAGPANFLVLAAKSGADADTINLDDLIVPVKKDGGTNPKDPTDPKDPPKDPEGPTDPVTPPTNPQDPSKDPEEKPTTPDKEKPTTPETTPEVPNEEPTDPNSPGVPAETPSNPAAPGQAADSALPGKRDAAKLPQTGEETNAGSLIGLLSLAVAGVLSLLAFRKKRR